jgi:hypothetical protein
MSWIQALKIWNRGRDVWCVPKGGTKEYDEVIDIMQNNPSAQRAPKRKKAAKAPKQKKGKKTAKNPFTSFPVIE